MSCWAVSLARHVLFGWEGGGGGSCLVLVGFSLIYIFFFMERNTPDYRIYRQT